MSSSSGASRQGVTGTAATAIAGGSVTATSIAGFASGTLADGASVMQHGIGPVAAFFGDFAAFA